MRVPNASLTVAGGEGSEGETMAAAAAAPGACTSVGTGDGRGSLGVRDGVRRDADDALAAVVVDRVAGGVGKEENSFRPWAIAGDGAVGESMPLSLFSLPLSPSTKMVRGGRPLARRSARCAGTASGEETGFSRAEKTLRRRQLAVMATLSTQRNMAPWRSPKVA